MLHQQTTDETILYFYTKRFFYIVHNITVSLLNAEAKDFVHSVGFIKKKKCKKKFLQICFMLGADFQLSVSTLPPCGLLLDSNSACASFPRMRFKQQFRVIT